LSYADFLTTITTLIAAIGAIATAITFISKNTKNKLAMRNVVRVILIVVITITGSIALITAFLHPTVAVNHVVTVPFPGQPGQIEAANNTVVVATTAPQKVDTTKTIVENRPLTCISGCYSGLKVILDIVVINSSQSNMTWHFTITNISTQGCAEMNVPITITDPAGVTSSGTAPGTLTNYTPLGAGQSLDEYSTVTLVPKKEVTYTMQASPDCAPQTGDTDQTETFTF